MDHIGFPVPELPARRVGKGDRWLEPVVVALNWDGSSRASVTAECSLEGFEWQRQLPDRQNPRDLHRLRPLHLAARDRQRPPGPAGDRRLRDHL